MKHYLAPVLRYQFTLFYRFGYTFIPDAILIPFDGLTPQAHTDDVTKLLGQVTPFEYDDEVVILHLQNDGELMAGNIKFDIQQLTTIYPLSQQAKIAIQQKADTRIVLGEPIFESSLTAIENTILSEETTKGIEALWSIYIEEENAKEEILSQIDLREIAHALDLRKKGKKAGELTTESYWSYLLTYERYDYFPKEPIGYFFDAGQLFAYSMGIAFEGSKLHTLLSELYSIRNTTSFEKIVYKIENDPLAAGYKSKTILGELRLYVLAPLFLLLKDTIRNAESFTEVKDSKVFAYAKEKFNLEFKAALILLGAFFKFKTFYDEYYNLLNLDIYQAQPQLAPTRAKAKASTAIPERNAGKATEETALAPEATIAEEHSEVDLSTPITSEEVKIDGSSAEPETTEVSVLSPTLDIPSSDTEKDQEQQTAAVQTPQNDEANTSEDKEDQKSPEASTDENNSSAELEKPKVQLGFEFNAPTDQGNAAPKVDMEVVSKPTPEKVKAARKKKSEAALGAEQEKPTKQPKAKTGKGKQGAKDNPSASAKTLEIDGFAAGEMVDLPADTTNSTAAQEADTSVSAK